MPLTVVQVNPDEESRQRLKMIRGEIDEPMRSAAPERTAQHELAQEDAARAAQAAQESSAAGDGEPGQASAGTAAPAQPQATPEEPETADRDDDSDLDDEGTNQAKTQRL